MIEIGDKYILIPAANTDHSSNFGEILRQPITGTVVQIHEEHRWFRVAWEIQPGRIAFECFKF